MLKAEQNLRIAMRDHLLYANLGVVGAVCYFALSEHGVIHALLVIPWACFILGWTYLCNGEKVSDIRKYLAEDITPYLTQSNVGVIGPVLAWETQHRSGAHRLRYKLIQLAVDLTAFVLSGLTAIIVYFLSIDSWLWWHYVALALSMSIMALLSGEYIRHFALDIRELRRFKTNAKSVD